jgi:hypothetical protein
MTEDWLIRAEAYCLRCGGHCCDDAHPPISEHCYRRLTGAGVPEPETGKMAGIPRQYNP